MSESIIEKIENIEKLLIEINAKIDNFLGFEDLSAEEVEEIRKLREEVKRGEFVEFEDVFEE
ncbi:MAG: hypothetical protein Q6362_002760 [Candidatus Wukongarchaeota archaeon]|jgi:hypothetical protein|nr:hypothetical protein [Candidatus Wukongarchaeota archaeon]